MKHRVTVLVLAAGLGTRMKSTRAKVLHQLGGRPLIGHVLRTVAQLEPDRIVVVLGHQADEVKAASIDALTGLLAQDRLEFVLQSEQRGTGHAVLCAQEALSRSQGDVLVVYGDVPRIRADTLRELVKTHSQQENAATLITAIVNDPYGYGRIVRTTGDDSGRFERIVEEKDASPNERKIKEINPGFYCFKTSSLLEALNHLNNDNAQGEYYLTDVPALALRSGAKVGTMTVATIEELMGINTRSELAETWRRMRLETLERLMNSGVTIVDPSSTYIDDSVEIGQDTIIHPQVIIEGNSRIGDNCEIFSWTRLRNVDIGSGCRVLNSCLIVDSKLTEKNSVGPFAHLRMNAELLPEAVVGNFVEVKKSRLGRKTKSMHLTYLGDATLGDRVNIGAGTVTCNYDGKQKNETHIEDDVKIGSDTMLVAPVRVGRGAVSAAGSVIIEDVPPDTLVAGVPAKAKKKVSR
jgi:bifunctional UDP-N-acetylglucosamine pyrophosphorylase / glucosamine-1-phosphate N-acetyltransferase